MGQTMSPIVMASSDMEGWMMEGVLRLWELCPYSVVSTSTGFTIVVANGHDEHRREQ